MANSVYIVRGGKQFGPYDESTLLHYVNNGQILLCDQTVDVNSGEVLPVRKVLRTWGVKPKIAHHGNLFSQLRNIGRELIVPQQTFSIQHWKHDKRLLMLASVGLGMSLLMLLPISGVVLFYAVALYFSAIWGLFFYYFFRTTQIALKTVFTIFFTTQLFVFLIWNVFHMPQFNPFYYLLDVPLLNIVGYVLGVGLCEELAKAIPLLIISHRAKEPLIPQTMVFYGLMSGIAFGVYEGVEYQMTVNAGMNYDTAFLYNVARLTSLPFLHAVWCGMAGYFIAFAKLYPKYRRSLYFLALAIPSTLHGLYDTLLGYRFGTLKAIAITFVGVFLLMNYLKQGINYQSKLRN